jgi:hypothetical protein
VGTDWHGAYREVRSGVALSACYQSPLSGMLLELGQLFNHTYTCVSLSDYHLFILRLVLLALMT